MHAPAESPPSSWFRQADSSIPSTFDDDFPSLEIELLTFTAVVPAREGRVAVPEPSSGA